MNPIIIAGAVAIAGFVAVSSKGKGAAQAQADVIINGQRAWVLSRVIGH